MSMEANTLFQSLTLTASTGATFHSPLTMNSQYYAQHRGVYLMRNTILKAVEWWCKTLPNMPKAYKSRFHGQSVTVLKNADGTRLDGVGPRRFASIVEEATAKSIMKEAQGMGYAGWLGTACTWEHVWQAYSDRYATQTQYEHEAHD
jgi:hypothetical protein